MILIDAVFINNSGGKVLLDYLIEQLELTDLEIYYLLDLRVRGGHPQIKDSNKVHYLQGSFLKRHRFYRRFGYCFTKVLCLSNLPPSIKIDAQVFTYFHNLLFLKMPQELSIFERFAIRAKSFIIQASKKNTNVWLVQSHQVSSILSRRWRLLGDKEVMIIPFYPRLESSIEETRQRDRFIYASTGAKHKNHKRLLKAFSVFYKKHRLGELHLTLGPEFQELINMIKSLQEEGVPIVNHGFAERSDLARLYNLCEYTVYPSLAESFGLGVIEAIDNGCKVIGADLPWIYAVCKPSGLFNPLSVEEMVAAFEKAAFTNLEVSEKLLNNEITNLIKLLD